MLGLQVGSKVLGIGAGVPSGVSAAILIGGTNDMTIAQKMGVKWEVKDPDGEVVDSYSDWEMFSTGPGLEQGFVGNQFILAKLGTYTVKADLLMNPDAPVIVDSYDDVLCVVTEAPPPEELIYEHRYPLAQTYVGKASEGTSTFNVFLPDQFFPSNWVVDKIISTFEEKVSEQGESMLALKIYEDKTPTWQTNYRIISTCTDHSPFPWVIVIPLVLAIILVVVIRNLVVEIKDIDWGEIPTPIPWAILAVAGGVGVLGVGAAVALATRRR